MVYANSLNTCTSDSYSFFDNIHIEKITTNLMILTDIATNMVDISKQKMFCL